MSLFFLPVLISTLALGAILPCETKGCSLLGEACDCLGQVCCDSSLNCTNGVCTGTPSVPNNDQFQPFPSIFSAFSYTELFVACGRRFPSVLYDAYLYPAGNLEPAANMPTRIFQACVEIASPPPCCAACVVDGVCSTSGGCICDPSFFHNANCSISGDALGDEGCPATTSSDLTLTKDDCQEGVQADGTYTFSFTITNLSPLDSLDVVLVDSFPSAYEIQTVVGGPCVVFANNSMSCHWDRVASQSSAVVRVNYLVKAGFSGRNVTNCATVSSATQDPNPNNNEDCDTNSVLSCVSYNFPCSSGSDCCSPLQCLRHSNFCNGSASSGFKCAQRGGSQLV
jgi:hypothetical protein